MLFLVGPHGAGKTKGASILSDLGMLVVDTGPIIRRIHKTVAPEIPIGEWVREGEKINGPDFTNEVIASEINRIIAESDMNKFSGLVIVGNRSLQGIRYIQLHVPNYWVAEDTIIYMDAPFELLKVRYETREGISLSGEEFEALLHKDELAGLGELISVADIYFPNICDELELSNLFHSLCLEKCSEKSELRSAGIEKHNLI